MRHRLAQLRQPEVENLHPPVVGDEHVLRLDVPVDDAFLVRGGQACRHGDPIFDRLSRHQRAVSEHVAQRLALQEFADDVRTALVRAGVVDGENVGVVQRGGGAGFLIEAAQAVSV